MSGDVDFEGVARVRVVSEEIEFSVPPQLNLRVLRPVAGSINSYNYYNSLNTNGTGNSEIERFMGNSHSSQITTNSNQDDSENLRAAPQNGLHAAPRNYDEYLAMMGGHETLGDDANIGLELNDGSIFMADISSIDQDSDSDSDFSGEEGMFGIDM